MAKFTAKQRAFIEAYAQCGNGVEAARRADYKGDDARLLFIAAENLRKPKIAEAIRARLGEQVMAADEVLARLSDLARGDMADFITVTDGEPVLDLAKAAQRGKLHLIKRTWQGSSGGWQIELYDAQRALVELGRHHKLFTDRVKHNGEIDVKLNLDALSDDELEQLADLTRRIIEGDQGRAG